MKYLVPLKSKNSNLHTEEDDFLQYFEREKICIMDNHRLAFWSWLNFINADDFGKCAYVHIDDHFDCGAKKDLVEGMMGRIKEQGTSYYKDINSFRNDKMSVLNIDTDNYHKTFNWGDYLIPAIFYDFFDNNKLYFFVKQDENSYSKGGLGDKCVFDGNIPKIKHFKNKNFNDLKKVFESENNIILNIDFDYFFEFINTPDVIKRYFLLIKNNSQKIKFTTVALTPEFDDWAETEKILKIYSDVFGLGVEIPLKIEK